MAVNERPAGGERNTAVRPAPGAREPGVARPLLVWAAALLCMAATPAQVVAAGAEAKAEPQAGKQGRPSADATRSPGAKPENRDWQRPRPAAAAPGPGGAAGVEPGKKSQQEIRRRAGARSGQGGGQRAGGQDGGRPPMFVGIDPVRKSPLTQTEPVIGRVVATRMGIVAARVSGAVVAIDVAVGQKVKKGRILARQDTSTAEARLAYDTAELKLAEQQLKRFESLRTNRSAAFARSRYDLAVHRLARAKANVRLARLAIEKAVVVAPFDGVIVRKVTELGSYLKDGAAVVELVNDTDVEIEADVPADRVRGLRPGRVVTFLLRAGGVPRRAKVRAVLPMQNALTRTQAVRFMPMGNPPTDRFSINQALTVNVPLGATRIVVSVHKDAIVNRGPMRMVFVVKGGRAVPRPVQLGDALGSRFVVRAGLAPGDIAVVRGNERLRPGQPVRHRPLMGAAAHRQSGNRSPAEQSPAN